MAYVDQLDYWLEPPALPQRSKISIGALGDEIRAIRIQGELIPLAIRDGEMRELEGPRPSGTVLLSNRIVEIHLAGTSARSLRLFYMLDGRYYLAQSFQKLGEEGSDFFSGPAEIPEGLPRFRIIDNSYGRELYVSSTQWRHGEGGDSIEITAY